MKNKLVVLAALTAAAIGAQDQTSVPSAGPPPLIRRDLVPAAVRGFPPLRRDLFSVQAYLPGGNPQESGPGFVTGPPEKGGPEEAPRPVFALRYVGFVQSQARTKFVGLVMFEGKFLAVEAGDTVGPGWKVLRLSAKEVEVEGPDGKIQVFAFEGELR
jgi:hypothetical protein